MSLTPQYLEDNVEHSLNSKDRAEEYSDAPWPMNPIDNAGSLPYYSQSMPMMCLDSSGVYQFNCEYVDNYPSTSSQENCYLPSPYSTSTPESLNSRLFYETASEYCDNSAASNLYHDERRPSYPKEWAQQVVNSIIGRRDASSEEYRASIARHSDQFLASASSLSFSGSSIAQYAHSVGSTFVTRSASAPQLQKFEDSAKRKRPSPSVEVILAVQEQIIKPANSPEPATELQFMPDQPMVVPSQNVSGSNSLSSSFQPFRMSPDHSRQPSPTRDAYRDHPRASGSPDSSLLLRDDPAEAPSTKRLHREELSSRAPWSGEAALKINAQKKNGDKKQALACLFCRERKIACGRPAATSSDQTCNQCARRRIRCEYPTESRRGQHKRVRRKTQDTEEGATQTTSSSATASPEVLPPPSSFST
ncbi:hypothetical protein BJ138DRAFT_1177206 [Hygrophoropsis aurantiaca]|uniref:Uncharacterized protein n=1 Tax=Hygrophoropsis aurantiaca TaxID=72124 RepID=A0ACB8AMN2_9AGAM|nr:hypothetical protein BJ138DRAFT_1177206 [Hygrophoropsis aurantiaca]